MTELCSGIQMLSLHLCTGDGALRWGVPQLKQVCLVYPQIEALTLDTVKANLLEVRFLSSVTASAKVVRVRACCEDSLCQPCWMPEKGLGSSSR